MTDKEIIIDGVNAAKCVWFKFNPRLCCIDRCSCSGNDCYYKQLKRKEQECEELKEDKRLALQLINGLLKEFNITEYDWADDQNEIHSILVEKFNKLQNENDNLKKECEELKEELQISKDDHAYAVELEKDIDYYKQALNKINTIILKFCWENCDECFLEDCEVKEVREIVYNIIKEMQ